MQAWLLITPKDSEQTNEQLYGGELPDIPFEYGHLPVFLSEIGTVFQGSDSLAPLTFTEIRAWGKQMKVNLTSFETSAIHKMSRTFASIANNRESECPTGSQTVRNNINQTNASAWGSLGKRSG